MRVAVIGASGFLGSALSRSLIRDGHAVCGFGRSEQRPPHLPTDVSWVPFDATRDAPEFPAGCDAVFYLSQSEFYRQFSQRADHVLAVNTLGAVKAAKAAAEANVRFFCYASSGTVYAPSFEPLSESAAVQRDDGYALSKVAAEDCLPLIAGDMTLTCVRIFGLFGPGQTGMLVPRLHERIRRGEPVTLEPAPGETDPIGGLRLSLCYVDDIVHCLVGLTQLATRNHVLPETLNLAGPAAVSIRELCDEIGRIADHTPVFQTLSSRRRFDLHADVTRLRSLLDLRFTDLPTALARTFADADTDSSRTVAKAG